MTKVVKRKRATLGAKGWAHHVSKGMATFSDVGMVRFAPRKYNSEGRAGDMERIGADMRRAFITFNSQTRKAS